MRNKKFKKKINLEKRFIVRKYIMAISASDALKKERKTLADDVWVDDNWLKENPNQLQSAIGFEVQNYD